MITCHQCAQDNIPEIASFCPNCGSPLVKNNSSHDELAPTPMATLESVPILHQTINGYALTRKLGEGGMGNVYYAEDSLGHKAAIKIMREDLCDRSDFMARFRNEIRSMVKLQGHPHIISLQATTYNTDQPVIIMEYLEGEDLFSYVKRLKQALDDTTLLEWSRQILSALQYAHEKGIIHRDVKPSNIFLTKFGSIKVLDFGIAKVTQEKNDGTLDETLIDSITKTRVSLGAPQFMSPEQTFDPKMVTHLSDIYSFGKTIHYLATGGGNPMVRVSANLDSIIKKCTENNPHDRYQSCKELLDTIGNKTKTQTNKTVKYEENFKFSELSPREQIHAYNRKYGTIFDFVIDDEDHVRIQRYYDAPSRSHVKIPDFVYGFSPKKNFFGTIKAIFPDLANVQSIELGSGIRDLGYMFYKSGSANLDLSSWDTSQVTNMSIMFSESQLHDVGDLSSWDTSQVTNMSCMFLNSQLHDVGDLSSWDTSQVTFMCAMFSGSQLKLDNINNKIITKH